MLTTDNGAPTKGTATPTPTPDPEVPAKAKARTFPADYKRRILEEYESLDRGQKGALLRREGLYSSLMTEWRRQRDLALTEGLQKKRGRPKTDPRDRRIQELERNLERTQAELSKARMVIEVQEKVSALLGELAPCSAEMNEEHGR